MKTVMLLLLVLVSSSVMAEGYYELSPTEMWQDSPTSRSFSDSRYRTRYSPAQIQAFTDQSNAKLLKRGYTELEKQQLHADEMSIFYQNRYNSNHYLDEMNRARIRAIYQDGR